MKLQSIARDIKRTIEGKRVLAWERRQGFELVRRAKSLPKPSARHVLIAPPGAGSTGDQAMVEAFVREVDGPVLIVTRRTQDVAELPSPLAQRVEFVALPGLLYGLPHQHLRDLRKLAPFLVSATSVNVVGADTMDGKYWESASVRRFRLAELGAEVGRPARVLGFSWNDGPSVESVRAMRTASEGALLLARDPVSERRLRSDGAVRVVGAADLAFLTEPVGLDNHDIESWLASNRRTGRKIAILNANGLLEADSRVIDSFIEILNEPSVSDWSFIALPHDSRGHQSDVELLRRFSDRAGQSDRLLFVDHLLSPGQIVTLAHHAALTVTGRMHLAILSSTAGTPAVSVGYQGKVAGLYELLGLDTWVESGAAARSGLKPMVLEAMENCEALRERLAAHMPTIRDLATRNTSI